MLRTTDLVIDDSNWQQHIDPTINGEKKARGCIPRNYDKIPQGFYTAAPAIDFPLIPRDEWPERIRELSANKAQVSDIRRRSGPGGGIIPSLDQDSVGYCWNHSLTMSLMLVRAIMGLPYVRLSAFMIGCLVKNYRDEGGWCALAMDFVTKYGVPSVEFWPEKSMKRSNDTPAMRENALLHRVIEQWADMSAAVYDRNLTEDQSFTLLLKGVPHPEDYGWWSHSVTIMDAVLMSGNRAIPNLNSLDLNHEEDAKVFGAVFGKRGINSWTDSYGDKGEFVLSGTKMRCNGGVAPKIIEMSDR